MPAHHQTALDIYNKHLNALAYQAERMRYRHKMVCVGLLRNAALNTLFQTMPLEDWQVSGSRTHSWKLKKCIC